MTTPKTNEPQPLLDLARLLVGIRRKRRMWVAAALLGMIVGGLLAVLLPTPPTAVVRIHVVHELDQPSDTGSLIRTDAALMASTKIASAALEELGSGQRAEDFIKEYTVTGVTNNVLEVSAEGATGAEAADRAEALADAFIADHVDRVQSAAAAEAKALTDQRTKIQDDLNKVDGEIAGAEAAALEENENSENDENGAPVQPNAAALDSLYARRAELTSRISDLTQQAEEAAIGAPRVAAGTQIVDAPRPVRTSLLVSGATNSAIGLVLGLAAGLALAAVTGVVRDKPVLRKDIAAHLGASVIAQLPAPARLVGSHRAARERTRVAATMARLMRTGSGPVSVLELGSPRIAAALTVDVAAELAEDGDVVIVEDPAGRVVADDPPGRRLDGDVDGPERPIRIVGAGGIGPVRPGETRVGLGSVTPGTPWTDLTQLGEETLLVVRAGFADTAWLHTVARQLADVGIPIVGVVLVDPDPRDRSDGTLWDGLHTALRGRAPVRERAKVNGTNGFHTVNGTNGTERSVHDQPTTRFAPVRPETKG